MTDMREVKDQLYTAVVRYGNAACPSDRDREWHAVSDAITALDNAAYDRAEEKVREESRAEAETTGREIRRLGWRLRDKDTEIARLHKSELGTERDRLNTALDRERNEAVLLRRRLELAELRWEDEANGAEQLLQERDAARADRDGFRGELELLHEHMSDERYRLRKALETLADRYHAQMCYDSHPRRGCQVAPKPVVDANKALAGESEAAAATCCGDEHQYEPPPCEIVCVDTKTGRKRRQHDFLANPGGAGNTFVVNKCEQCGIAREEVVSESEPEIEAVLMGTPIKCVCGCDFVVDAGQCAYRFVHGGLTALLYASEACARKAARPKARSHPPYAAYGDTMRREES